VSKNLIPPGALDRHIAFLGATGSGKTSGAKRAVVEPALIAKERVHIIDPAGAWWGLRMNSDGVRKGFPIFIFGGDHGDYPLRAKDAEMLADAFGTSSDSAIFDTSLMNVSERTAFFTEFAEAIRRKNRGPLKFIIDEAHLFMPQAGAQFGGATPAMLHAGNNLVSLGRSKGLRITLISQRPAKLHKDSLTQVQSMVAMRLMAPQDRKAIAEWIADQADPERGKEIIASLPTLKPGEAWVWAPQDGVLDRVKFPLPKSFDSSKAPTSAGDGPQLPPIDLDKLTGRLKAVETERKANDPKALRAEIVKLTSEMARMRNEPRIDDGAIQAAEQRGYLAGHDQGLRAAEKSHMELNDKVREALADFNKTVARVLSDTIVVAVPQEQRSLPLPKSASPAAPKAKAVDTPIKRPAPAARVPSPAASGDGSLTGPQAALLQALAWWKRMGHDAPTRIQCAAIAGWKTTGSNIKNRLSELSQMGMVTYPATGKVSLTASGLAHAPEPDMSATLVDSVRKILTGPQTTAFNILLKQGEEMTRSDLASACGWEEGGSNIKNRLSELSRLEIVTYPGTGRVQLQDWITS